MVKLTTARISRLIYPVGFYHTEARVIREISERLISEYSGKVPADREDLLDFKGVGKSR
jgi:endonuclease-3